MVHLFVLGSVHFQVFFFYYVSSLCQRPKVKISDLLKRVCVCARVETSKVWTHKHTEGSEVRLQHSSQLWTHTLSHTHTLDLCFCPWTYSKNRLNTHTQLYKLSSSKCYHINQTDSGLGNGMTFSMRSTAVFSYHIQTGLLIVLVDW